MKITPHYLVTIAGNRGATCLSFFLWDLWRCRALSFALTLTASLPRAVSRSVMIHIGLSCSCDTLHQGAGMSQRKCITNIVYLAYIYLPTTHQILGTHPQDPRKWNRGERACVCVCVDTYTHKYKHEYIYTHIEIFIYVCIFHVLLYRPCRSEHILILHPIIPASYLFHPIHQH